MENISKRTVLSAAIGFVAALIIGFVLLSALPVGPAEDHTHHGAGALHESVLPGWLTLDKSDANSTSYCPAYDYHRNGYFWDYRFSYVQGNTHYHRYWRSGDGALVIRNRACALVQKQS